MKKLLFIALLAITFNANAQYSKSYNPPKGWKSPELYVPVTIIASTYLTNNQLGYSVSYGTRTTIALTGIATSLITHFVFKKIRTKKKYH